SCARSVASPPLQSFPTRRSSDLFHPLFALGAGLSLTQIGALSSIRSWASSSSRFGSGPLFSRFNPAGFTLPLVIVGTLATCAIPDRKSTRLNSSHQIISYAVFCL